MEVKFSGIYGIKYLKYWISSN